jgi:hypothetical protein
MDNDPELLIVVESTPALSQHGRQMIYEIMQKCAVKIRRLSSFPTIWMK